MADARTEVLARIRAALSDGPSAPVVPSLPSQQPPTRLLELFAERLRDYGAMAVLCPSDGVTAAVASAASEARRVVIPVGLPQAWRPPQSEGDDPQLTPNDIDQFDAVVTGCAAAAAETGTIALDASADQGRRMLSLIPDLHICIVPADRVAPDVASMLARLDPQRPLTLVSGGSATSDIELRRIEGVHGPRRLVVIIVDEG